MEYVMDFSNQKVVICGLQGSGKTTLAKKLVMNKRTLVYTPHLDEWEDMPDNIILYKWRNFYTDVEEFLKIAKKLGLKREIDGVVIDEFDMLFKSNWDINKIEILNDITINHRHYNLFVIGITRRPQDVPSKIFESSKYIISFALQSPNAIRKFNEIYTKMGDMIKKLDYYKHEFLIKEIAKEPIKISSYEIR